MSPEDRAERQREFQERMAAFARAVTVSMAEYVEGWRRLAEAVGRAGRRMPGPATLARMAEYGVHADELYPHLTLSRRIRPGGDRVALTDAELADYLDVCARWEAWQRRLGLMQERAGWSPLDDEVPANAKDGLD